MAKCNLVMFGWMECGVLEWTMGQSGLVWLSVWQCNVGNRGLVKGSVVQGGLVALIVVWGSGQ